MTIRINEITQGIWNCMDWQKMPREHFIFTEEDEGEEVWVAIDNTTGENLFEVFTTKQDALSWLQETNRDLIQAETV